MAVEGGAASISTKSLIAASTATSAVAGGAVTMDVVLNKKNTSVPPPTANHKVRFSSGRSVQAKTEKTVYVPLVGDCIKDYFDDFDISNLEKKESTDKPHKPFTEKNNELSKGCLIVNWKKKSGKEDHWKGMISWEWILTAKNEGFILSGKGKNSSTEAKKIDLIVELIGLKKETSGNDKGKWKHDYYKSISVDGIDKTSPNDENKFPRGFKNDEYDNDNAINEDKRSWGFSPWYDKSCKFDDKVGDCNFELDDTSKTSFKRWDWTEMKEESEVKYDFAFSDMHSNFDKFWKTSYQTSVDLGEIVNKKGIWR